MKVGTAATIHSTGQFNIGVAATIFANGNATYAGIVTASNTTISSTGIGIGAATNGSANYPSVTISGNSGGAVHFEDDGDLLADIYGSSDGLILSTRKTSDAITFQLNSGSVGEKARFDSSGRLLVNTTTSRACAAGEHKIQVENTSTEGISLTRTTADAGGINISFIKTRNGDVVQSGDDCGAINWFADDGTDTNSYTARIQGAVDGTPGSNDTPGRLVFSTTNDGGHTTTERLRINSSGQVLIGGTSSVNGWGQTNRLQVHGSTWSTSGVTIAKLGGNSNSPNLVFTASRGSSVGTVVQNGDRLGYITFTGDDGTDVNSNAAKIYCEVDGSPGSNDLPGRLIFSTTADGADSASERLRISSDGGVALTGHSECSINALGNSSGTVTIDFRTANYISCTLTGTTTFANPTTESVGQSGSIIITQDGTGSRTASWGSQFKWVGGTAPTLTTTAAAVDRIDYLVVAADTIHCVASLDVK